MRLYYKTALIQWRIVLIKSDKRKWLTLFFFKNVDFVRKYMLIQIEQSILQRTTLVPELQETYHVLSLGKEIYSMLNVEKNTSIPKKQ